MSKLSSPEYDKQYENLPTELIQDLLMCLDHTTLVDGCFCSHCNYQYEHDGKSVHENDCIPEAARRYLKDAGIDSRLTRSVN